MLRYVLLIVILTTTIITQAQEVTEEPPLADVIRAQFRASAQTPLAGEPVRLELIVDMPTEAELIVWPEFTESWGPFMVQEASDLDVPDTSRGERRYRQVLTVILWQPGDYETPDTFIGYRVPDIDETYFVPFTPLFFNVPSVVDPNDLELRPFREPISLRYLSPVLILGIIFAAVSAGAGLRWWWLRRQSRRPVPVIERPSPLQEAERALRYLNENNLNPQDTVTSTIDVLRTYLYHRLDLPAPKQTIGELEAVILMHESLPEPYMYELQRLLEQGDLVKFAAAEVSQDDAGRFLNATYRWIASLEDTLNADPSPNGNGV